MHRKKCRAKLRHAFDALLHSIADIVQLEIEKHLLAGGDQCRRKRQAPRKSELIADFVETHCFAQPRHHRFRRLHRGQVEGDDQALAWTDGHVDPHIMSCAISTSRSSCARSRLAAPVSARLSMASKACSAWAIVTCSGITSAPQPSSRICRSAISERAPPSACGEAEPMAKTRFLKAA